MPARRLAPLVIGALLLLVFAGVIVFLQYRQDSGALSLTPVAAPTAVDPGLSRPDGSLSAPEKGAEADRRRAVQPSTEPAIAASGVQLRVEVVDEAGVRVTEHLLTIDRLKGTRSVAVLPWTEVVASDGRSVHAIPQYDGWKDALVEVRATIPAYHTTILELAVPELESGAVQRIVLNPASIIAGVVVQEDGKPIDRARVVVHRADGEAIGSTTTDYKGAFHIESEFPGVLEQAKKLCVTASGFVPRWIERVGDSAPWGNLRVVMDGATASRATSTSQVNARTSRFAGAWRPIRARRQHSTRAGPAILMSKPTDRSSWNSSLMRASSSPRVASTRTGGVRPRDPSTRVKLPCMACSSILTTCAN